MRRDTVALAGALLLAGCPIPQAVPELEGAVAPPRIVMANSTTQIAYPATVIPVASGCAAHPTFDLSTELRDSVTDESIQARWFVNYDLANGFSQTPQHQQTISVVDSNDPTLRRTDTWTFDPYAYPSYTGGVGSADGALHVVELVVSNGFSGGGPLPNRSPAAGFEVQLYRWVFLNAPEPGGCTSGAAGCCP